MLIQVSEQRLSELRAMSARQLMCTLTQQQIERVGLEGFEADGTRVIVMPRPAISQDGEAVRAALRNTHDYVALSEAPSDELERAERRWIGRQLEAVRPRIVTYSRDNWLSVYPSTTWRGSGDTPAIVWYCGDDPKARRLQTVANMGMYNGVDGYGKILRSIPGYYSLCIPWPEVERRLDEGSLRELFMLANCYAI